MKRDKVTAGGSQRDWAARAAKERISALIRLITYARDEARTLEAEVLAFCLEAAVSAAHQAKYGGEASRPKRVGHRPLAAQRKSTSDPVH